MASPPTSPSRVDLQGASRMTGGILRGRAQGNVYNIADAMPDDAIFTGPVKGNVHIYNVHGNPDSMEPYMLVKHDVTPNIGPVLKKLAAQYSPVRSKLLIS